MARAHTHPDIEVNYLLKGSMRYFMGGRFHEIREGEVAIFWAGMPHQTMAKSTDVEGIWMTLPLVWLLRWRHAAALGARLLKGSLVSYAATITTRELFVQWARDFEGGGAGREIMIGEVEAYFSRVSVGLKESGRRRKAVPPAVQRVEEITVYLGERYRDEISVDEVANAMKLHPKYLLTLFRQACGMTLWEYVTRLRLAHAQRLLLTTDRTVLDVAMEAGFGSASAFYQAFRKYEGRSPAKYRGG
ncbi:helix-turn-helix domain-containing protein [soil metagenome]